MLNMDLTRKLSFLVFALCVLICLKNQHAETRKGAQQLLSWQQFSASDPPSSASSSPWPFLTEAESNSEETDYDYQPLQYDFYHLSCPNAERMIQDAVRRLYQSRPQDMPALLRLVFHDCFIEGCDASILLDTDDFIDSEKDSGPNQSVRGFDSIDTIKQELEEKCPGIVSCADILVLAAREVVLLGGGPFYPLKTGRRDSMVAYPDIASLELPSPQDDLSKAIASFASKGFDQRETVSLLGGHSIGMIQCQFFMDRLYNFSGVNKPDPSMDAEFLMALRSRCNNSHNSSPHSSALPSPSVSPSFENNTQKTKYEGPGSSFGSVYYRSLLQRKGILYVDQQLTTMEETAYWVRAYASDISLFNRDFALAMIKLSNHQVLTAPVGQVRHNCRRVFYETQS